MVIVIITGDMDTNGMTRGGENAEMETIHLKFLVCVSAVQMFRVT